MAERTEQTIAILTDSFKNIFHDSWGPRTEYILLNVLRLLCTQEGANLLSIPKVLADAEYRKRLIACCKDPLVQMFWMNNYEKMTARFREESVSPIRNKVGRFLEPVMRNILGQKENKIDFKDAMNQSKIVLIKLSKGIIGETNSQLLGNFLLSSIQQAAFSRSEQKERKAFPIFVDELQHFSVLADSIFKTILSEGLKFGLQLITAFQHISQLKNIKNSIFGNIRSLISFSVSNDDARTLAQYLEEIEQEDLINLPPYHGYLRAIRKNNPFISSFKTLPPEISKNSFKELVREFSRLKYCRPRQEVENEISRFLPEQLPITLKNASR